MTIMYRAFPDRILAVEVRSGFGGCTVTRDGYLCDPSDMYETYEDARIAIIGFWVEIVRHCENQPDDDPGELMDALKGLENAKSL